MELRAYRPEDCPAMGALFYDTVHTVCTGEYNPRQLDAWAPPEGVDLAAWHESFSAHVTLVAVENGAIVGFGDMAPDGYLDRLYVASTHLRRGVASALCAALEQAVPARRYTTHASRTALPFFLARGWRVVKEQTVERRGVTLNNYVMEKEPSPHGGWPLRPPRNE